MLAINFSTHLNAQELIEEVLVKRQVDKTAQYQLRSILLQETFSDDDRTMVDRILYGVRRGILQLAA